MQESDYVLPPGDVQIEAKPRKAKKDGSAKFERLAKKYIEHLCDAGRYPLFHNGRFYQYAGTHYAEDRELCFSVRSFFKSNELSQSNNIIGNVVPVIQTYAFRPTVQYPALPFYVGKDQWPEPKYLIAYKNGLLDASKFLTGETTLLPHTPKWCSTFALPFSFDTQATCPMWFAFLNQVFEGDEARIALLQEWFGYCLTADTSLQKALMQMGKKRSGKGTTQYILQQLLGSENWTAYDLGSLSHNFGICSLDGRAVAFVGEVELSGHPQRATIMEKLKGIIGEDVQQVEVKYDPVKRSVRLPARFMIGCNEMPTFFDASGAIGSRFLFLHYQRSFAGNEDTGLKEKLSAELAGINNWALGGLARLRANGGKFTIPETTRQLQADFNRRSAPVQAFVSEVLAVQPQYDPGDLPGVVLVDKPLFIERQKCYKLYSEWCEEHGLQPCTDNYFGRDIFNVVPKMPKNARPVINGKRTMVYVGIGLRPAQEANKSDTVTAPAPPALAADAAPAPTNAA